MKNYSIIFDLDGTLLNTLVDLAESTNTVLAEMGFSIHDIADYNLFVGGGLYNLMQQVTPVNTDKITIEKCCVRFQQVYEQNWTRNCYPYDGINDMLAKLSAVGVQFGVLSNKPHTFTEMFIREFFDFNQFAAVYGQRDDYPQKPDPTVALAMAKLFGTTPECTFFVGDSGVDMQTAANAKMKAVGVSWGFRSTEELLRNNSNIIIDHPEDLLRYVFSFS